MNDVTFENGSYGEYAAFLRLDNADNSRERGRLVANLGRALREELTERQRLMITMHYLDGMSSRKIASELGVCPSTVSRTLARGRARLKRCLRYGARELLSEYADGD